MLPGVRSNVSGVSTRSSNLNPPRTSWVYLASLAASAAATVFRDGAGVMRGAVTWTSGSNVIGLTFAALAIVRCGVIVEVLKAHSACLREFLDRDQVFRFRLIFAMYALAAALPFTSRAGFREELEDADRFEPRRVDEVLRPLAFVRRLVPEDFFRLLEDRRDALRSMPSPERQICLIAEVC